MLHFLMVVISGLAGVKISTAVLQIWLGWIFLLLTAAAWHKSQLATVLKQSECRSEWSQWATNYRDFLSRHARLKVCRTKIGILLI